MNVEERSIDELVVPEYCRRSHSDDQIGRCVEDLKRHSQYQPIVVAGNEILCGVLVYLSLKKMGAKTIWVNDLGDLPQERRKEIRYLDNQIFDIEDWDGKRIQEFLMDLPTDELDKYGFTKDEVDQLVNLDGTSDGSKMPEWKDEWECDGCGWRGQLP